MNAERKYTDRDVRRDPGHAFWLVQAYLEEYNGEFEFLVDCKMRLATHMDLTTGMVRGVLNCMRADPRYKGEMPEFDHTQEEADVIPMQKPARRKLPRECDIQGFHEPHPIGPEEWALDRWRCYGKYELNRETYTRAGRVADKYRGVVARTGAIVHGVSGVASVSWYPNRHEPDFYMEPKLSYQTLCHHPAWINHGVLLTSHEMDLVIEDRTDLNHHLMAILGYDIPPSQRKPLALCRRCF